MLDLGWLPAPVVASQPLGPAPRFEVRLWLCAACGLAQLPSSAAGAPPVEDLIGPGGGPDLMGWLDELGTLAQLSATGSGTVLEIPGPGRPLQPHRSRKGLRPTTDPRGAVDLVLESRFALMRAADQRHALLVRARRLGRRGRLVLHVPSLAALLRHARWDRLRPGVNAYYSTPALVEMLARVGLVAEAAREFPTHGTVAILASRVGDEDASVQDLTDAELRLGVRDPNAFTALQDAVEREIATVRDALKEPWSGPLYGYGATPRAVALLNRVGIDLDTVAGVADPAPAVRGLRIPGTAIPICSPADLGAAEPATVLNFTSSPMGATAPGARWIDVRTA